METKSFVMFSTKTKTYAEDIDLGNRTVVKAGTPVNIAWMSFADPESGELAAAFADDDTLLAMIKKVQTVKRVSKSGKPRIETRFPVKVVYNDTEDPGVKEVIDLVELPPPALRVCNKASAAIAAMLG